MDLTLGHNLPSPGTGPAGGGEREWEGCQTKRPEHQNHKQGPMVSLGGERSRWDNLHLKEPLGEGCSSIFPGQRKAGASGVY